MDLNILPSLLTKREKRRLVELVANALMREYEYSKIINSSDDKDKRVP